MEARPSSRPKVWIALQPSIVKIYKVAGLVAFTAILLGLIWFLVVNIFYFFDHSGDKDVVVCTASILQQCLNAGLMDEIYLDVAPLLLGKGVRLFEHLDIDPITLERIHVVEAPGVTHMAFRAVK